MIEDHTSKPSVYYIRLGGDAQQRIIRAKYHIKASPSMSLFIHRLFTSFFSQPLLTSFHQREWRKLSFFVLLIYLVTYLNRENDEIFAYVQTQHRLIEGDCSERHFPHEISDSPFLHILPSNSDFLTFYFATFY